MEADLIEDICPPIEETDPTLPPAARSAAPQDARSQNVIAKHLQSGIIAGIRRDEQAMRAKERVFSAARRSTAHGTSATSRPNSGTITRPTCRPARMCASTRCCTGPRLDIWRYIAARRHSDRAALSRQETASATARSAKRTSPPDREQRRDIDEIIAELETTRTPERAGRSMDHETEDAFERLRAHGYM